MIDLTFLAVAFAITIVIMTIYTCYQLGGTIRETGNFWTCYYLLVPNWLTQNQFETWMKQNVSVGIQQVTRKRAFNISPEFAELTIRTISEVLTSPAPYEVYEIVTV